MGNRKHPPLYSVSQRFGGCTVSLKDHLRHRPATKKITVFLCALLVSLSAAAHHSFAVYDKSKVVEVEGTLMEFSWSNPHVRFKLRSVDSQHKETVWDIESSSLSILRRTDATPDNLRVGDRVKIAAWPTRQSSNKLFVLNVLTANNRELVLNPGSPTRWTTTAAAGTKTTWFTEGTEQSAQTEHSIFRVWSTALNDPHSSPTGLWPKEYPLTDKGRAAKAKWNPDVDSTQVGCTPKGMPTIMEQPYPMEFVQKGDAILIRIEEHDTVRTLHMNAKAPNPMPPPQILGYSVAHWEGDTLVATTSNISWPYFNSNGIPQSKAIEITERFTPSKDGSRLEYKAVATDANVFTKPVALEKHWVWRPEERVRPYDCRG